MLRRYNAVPICAGTDRMLGIPPVAFSDGPRGVVMGTSTCFPVSMARGASWDPDLEERIGEAIGIEANLHAHGGANVDRLRRRAYEDLHALAEQPPGKTDVPAKRQPESPSQRTLSHDSCLLPRGTPPYGHGRPNFACTIAKSPALTKPGACPGSDHDTPPFGAPPPRRDRSRGLRTRCRWTSSSFASSSAPDLPVRLAGQLDVLSSRPAALLLEGVQVEA